MSDELLERLTRIAQDALVQTKVKSAMNPCLWLCALVVIPSLTFAYLTTGLMQIAALVLAFIPILLSCVAYLYFMIRDPDKLQSESFQLRKQALGLIEEKGRDIPVAITSVEILSNPELPSQTRLPGRKPKQ